MQTTIEFGIAARDWLADSNFYVSALIGLVVTSAFIRKNRSSQDRNPPTGALIYVLFESLALTGICICMLRLLTGAFHTVLHAEENICFFVGSSVMAYVLFNRLDHAFKIAGTSFESGYEPPTKDY